VWFIRSLVYDNDSDDEADNKMFLMDDFEIDIGKEFVKTQVRLVEITLFKMLCVRNMWENSFCFFSTKK
jgi:hypothetical protein